MKRPSLAGLLLLALLGGLTLASCTGYGDSCSSSGECLGGLVCTGGVCRTKEYDPNSGSTYSNSNSNSSNNSQQDQCNQASSLCAGYYNQCASNPVSQAPCYCAAACVCHHCGQSCEAANRQNAASLGTSCSY